MKASEFDALLKVARRHKVLAFELGTLKVQLSAQALEDTAPVRRTKRTEQDIHEDALETYSAEPFGE